VSKREYIVTDNYIRPVNGQVRHVISERVDGGPWQAFVDVLSDDAMDVLGALRRAYQDGREDRSGELLP
jgi:hypothetical protein